MNGEQVNTVFEDETNPTFPPLRGNQIIPGAGGPGLQIHSPALTGGGNPLVRSTQRLSEFDQTSSRSNHAAANGLYPEKWIDGRSVPVGRHEHVKPTPPQQPQSAPGLSSNRSPFPQQSAATSHQPPPIHASFTALLAATEAVTV